MIVMTMTSRVSSVTGLGLGLGSVWSAVGCCWILVFLLMTNSLERLGARPLLAPRHPGSKRPSGFPRVTGMACQGFLRVASAIG